MSSSCRVDGGTLLSLDVVGVRSLTGVDWSVHLVEGAIVRNPPHGGLQNDMSVSH